MGALKNLNMAGPGPMAKDHYGNPNPNPNAGAHPNPIPNPNPNALHPNAAGRAGAGGPWNPPAFGAPAPFQQAQGVVNAHPLPVRPPASKEEEKKKDKGFAFKKLFKSSKKEDPVAAAKRGFESAGPGYYHGGEQQQQQQPGPQPGAGSWEQQERRDAYFNQPEGPGSSSSGGYVPHYLAEDGSSHGRRGYGRSGNPGRLQPQYAEEGYSPGGDEEPPEELRCPISTLLMAEPVVVQSGVAYEKRCFEAWYNSGQRYCLRTEIVLEAPSYIQNIGLARQIATWCQHHQRRLPDPPTPELANYYVQKIQGLSGSDAQLPEYAAPIRPGSGHGRHTHPPDMLEAPSSRPGSVHANRAAMQPDYGAPIRPASSVHAADPRLAETPPLPQYYVAPARPGSGHGRHSDPHMGEAPVPQEYASPTRPGAGYGDPRMGEAPMRKAYISPGAYGAHSDPNLNGVQVQRDYDYAAHVPPADVYGRHSDPHMGGAPVQGYPDRPGVYGTHSGQHDYAATNPPGARAWQQRELPPQEFVAPIPPAAHSRRSSSTSDDEEDSAGGEAFRPPSDTHAQHPPPGGDGFTYPGAAGGAHLGPEPESRFRSEHGGGDLYCAPEQEDSSMDGGRVPEPDAYYSTPADEVSPAYLPQEEETLTAPEDSDYQDDGFRVSLTLQVPELAGTRHSASRESGSNLRPPPSLIPPQNLSGGESDRESDFSGETPSNPRHGSVDGSNAVPRFGPGPRDSATPRDAFRPLVPSDQYGLPPSESLPSAPDLQSVRGQGGMPPPEEPGVHPYSGPHSGSSSSGSSEPPSGSFPRKQESEPAASASRYNHSSSWMPSTHQRPDTGGGNTLPLPLNTVPSSYSGRQSPHRDIPQGPFPDVVQKLYARHPKEQEEGAAEIRRLTRESVDNRISLCSGELTDKVLGGLMELLPSRHPGVQVNAVAAIMNLSLEKENKLKIARAGVIPHLIELLQRGTPEAQEIAAGAMFSLALNDENKMAIGVLGGIPHLVHILKAARPGARRDAAMALYHLAFVQMNRTKLVRAGGVNILLQIAHENQSDLVSRALLILSHLALIPEGRAALSEMSNIQTLVALLKGPIADGGIGEGPRESWAEVQEHAAAALFQLSNHNMRFKSQVMQAGAEEHLSVLAATGTPRAREKATSLLRIMRDNPGQEGGRESAYPVRGRGRLNMDQDRGENSALF